MAVTKIHPIKTTLKKAIDYICNGDKTNDEIYVSTHLCSRENAHKEFELTKKQFNSRTKTLAHHLIQSFAPGEVSFEEAYQVGIELCSKILEDKYEYVIATHIEKEHVHNHIIFNSVDVDEGKVYHSYYGSYMNIRNQSDILCKEHNLSVIDNETAREIKKIKNRKFTSWYDWSEDKKGKSFKSKLQFDIDRIVKDAKDFEDFLQKMRALGYEIKQGKHIAFKHKDKQRFTRAKTIGYDYTEDRIKDRITSSELIIGDIIDKSSDKIKGNQAYEFWATKQNLDTISTIVLEMRKLGFDSQLALTKAVDKMEAEMNQIRDNFNAIKDEEKAISIVHKHIEICVDRRIHYEGYKDNPRDKIYYMMNKKDIEKYKTSAKEINKFCKKYPHLKASVTKGIKDKSAFKELNIRLDAIQAEKNDLIEEYKKLAQEYEKLNKMLENYMKYMGVDRNGKKSIHRQLEECKKISEKTKSRTVQQVDLER